MKTQWNNITLIDTYNTIGTGILLPCEYNNHEERGCYSYYIILSNYHVVYEKKDITDKTPKLDHKKIHLTIYDINDHLIPEEDYKIIDSLGIFSVKKAEDLVILLLGIKEEYEIKVTDTIYKEEPEEGTEIRTKGFPGLLQEEFDAVPMRFSGTLQQTFYEGGKMGAYKIDDSIHYYENYHDEVFLGGMSGGPVYTDQNGHYELLGMNQGIFANNMGDSPYRLIRYISIKYILEYFRQNGAILYSLLHNKISIIWTKEGRETTSKTKEALCIIGGSGAGKSSFVESISQNGYILDTTGDGQTTRTDIYYYLSLCNPNPTIKIKYLTKKEFIQKCFDASFPDVLAAYMNFKFGIEKVDIREKQYIFLQNNLEYLECMLEGLKLEDKFNEELEHIKEGCLNVSLNEENEFIQKNYIQFARIMNYCLNNSYVSKEIVEKIFNQRIRENLIRKLLHYNDITHGKTMISEFDHIDLTVFYESIKPKSKITEYIQNPQLLTKELKKIYVESVLEYKVPNDNHITEKEREAFYKNIHLILVKQQGIFDKDEIGFLFEESSETICDYSNDKLEKDLADIFEFSNSDMNPKYENLYGEIYHKVMEHLQTDKERYEKGISIQDMDQRDREKINLHVSIKRNFSLSAFVKQVEVHDSYYYEYAIPVYESGHDEMLLIDTRGLDHIDRGKNLRCEVKNKIDELKDSLNQDTSSPKKEYKLDNIIYVKKMDAGKPTEISDIFSYIADIDINGGLYCVFNGIDIYEESNHSFFARNKNWHIDKNSEGYPKAMRYLLDMDNQEELLRFCNSATSKKESLYRVMSNNIITYCGNKNIWKNNEKYESNNIKGIKLLFESIFHNEMDIIQIGADKEQDKEKFKTFIEEKKHDQVFKEQLKEQITLMFELASITKWDKYYWQTLNANLNTYKYGNDNKGYLGVWNHTWVYLFQMGYFNAFEKNYAEVFFNLFDKYKDKVFISIKQMQNKFVNSIIYKKTEEKLKDGTIEKICILQKMFDECCKQQDPSCGLINAYDINSIEEAIPKEKTKHCSDLAKELNRITDFGLLIRQCPNEYGVNKIMDTFLETLIETYNTMPEQIEKNFFDSRADVRNQVDQVIQIIKSYGYEADAVKALIWSRIK